MRMVGDVRPARPAIGPGGLGSAQGQMTTVLFPSEVHDVPADKAGQTTMTLLPGPRATEHVSMVSSTVLTRRLPSGRSTEHTPPFAPTSTTYSLSSFCVGNSLHVPSARDADGRNSANTSAA